MKVEHKQREDGGQFYIFKNGENIAEMEYELPGEQKMIITHTEVNEAFRGKKLGEFLVVSGVEHARNMQLKLVPLCTYAKAIIDKNDEMKDVL